MATLSTVLSFARAQAQTDSNGLTDANGIIFANEALLDFRRQLIAHGVDASQTQEAYRNITSGVGTYLYPTDMFFLKAIEINPTDTTQQNFLPAQQVDASNLPGGTSFDWLRVNQSKDSPLFDDRGDWYEIFPTPTSGQIKIIYFLQPTEYTATSDTVAYPESLDYRILGWRIAGSYKYQVTRYDEGDKFFEQYEKKVKELISTLARGSQQPIESSNIRLTGWEF